MAVAKESPPAWIIARELPLPLQRPPPAPLLHSTKRWVIKSYFSGVALFYAAYIFKILLHCCSTHDRVLLLFGLKLHFTQPIRVRALACQQNLTCFFLVSNNFCSPLLHLLKKLLRCCAKEKKIFKTTPTIHDVVAICVFLIIFLPI